METQTSVGERRGTSFEEFGHQKMVADHQIYTVVEGCTGRRGINRGCSITDNYDEALMDNSHNICCKIRVSYIVTENLNA